MAGLARGKLRMWAPLTLALALFVLGVAPGRAAVIEATVYTDLSLLDLPSASIPSSGVFVTTPIQTALINAGDTFILHYRFVNGQLRVIDTGVPSVEYMEWRLYSDPFLTGFLWDTKFTFEGVSGELLTNDFTLNYGGPIGAFLPDVNLTDTTFAFTGITLTFTNSQNFNAGEPPFIAAEVNFRAFFHPADGLFVRVNSIPEPSALSLLVAALIAFGFGGGFRLRLGGSRRVGYTAA